MDTCNVTISGTKLKIYDTAANCDTAATITGLTDADQIIFGSGLRLEGSAGIYTVHSEENVTVGGSVYSNIQVAGNLSAIPTGCDVIISGSEFRLKFSDTVSTCHVPTLSGITDAEHIYIGSGLSFTYEGAYAYQINSLGLVNIDGSPYTGIKLAGNLTAISDGCTVTISGDTGISSGISVVCDVDCSGNNFIVASTRTLTFNDGLLTNGGTCASEISASEVRWSAVAGWVSNLVSNTTLPSGVSHFVTAATAAGDILITLATTASQMLYQTIITKTTAANEVIISGQAGALINGASTYTLTHLYETVKLNTDGTNYYIV